MTQKLIEKVKKMNNSSDEEMRDLAKVIFWTNDPSYKDYQTVCDGQGWVREDEWPQRLERNRKIYSTDNIKTREI